MLLPDYNATPSELLAFIKYRQSGFNQTDAQWYELDIWRGIVNNMNFNDGDRKRLFEYLKRLVPTDI